MKNFVLLLVTVFLVACKSATKNKPVVTEIKKNNLKERSPVIEKVASFINLNLDVSPYSRDSIVVHISLINNWNKEFRLYKPLLPFDNMTEDLLSILEKKSYERLDFIGENQENYLQFESEPTTYIVPQLSEDHFISLQPGQTLEIKSNIAKKYSFEKFLKKNLNEFAIIYVSSFPYVIDGKQVTELDSVDNKQKPVYYLVTVKENKDPDLMRVSFKIPH